MAKKTPADFTAKKKATNATPVIDPIRAKATKGATDTNDIKDTTDADRTEYRFSARFTPQQWHFLEEMKWQTRRSITAILQDYVEEDMKKNPDILKTIDELNG